MQYSVSDNPLGPFTPCGVYMYPQGEETAHGSIVEYNGNGTLFIIHPTIRGEVACVLFV